MIIRIWITGEGKQSCGVIFLENESRQIMIHGMKLHVSGLELPLSTYEKFRKKRVEGTDVAERLGFWPEGQRRGGLRLNCRSCLPTILLMRRDTRNGALM